MHHAFQRRHRKEKRGIGMEMETDTYYLKTLDCLLTFVI